MLTNTGRLRGKLRGGASGTEDYPSLKNKPQINGVTLEGDQTPEDLQMKLSQLTNDAGYAKSSIVAPEYSEEATYDVGDYVTYENTLYKCNSKITTAEEWNPEHWTAVNVAEIIPTKTSDLNNDSGYTSSTVIAEAYNATSTYAVGDYVTHENNLYKCNTAITTAEEWNAEHWTLVDVISAIPTKTSELDNDSGFVTGDNYYDKSEIDTALSGKADAIELDSIESVTFTDPTTVDKLSYDASKVDNSLKRVLAILPPNTVVTSCKQLLTSYQLTYVTLEVYEWNPTTQTYTYNRSISAKSAPKYGTYYLHDFGSLTTRNGCLLTFTDTTSSGWLRGSATLDYTMLSFNKSLTSVTLSDLTSTAWTLGSYISYITFSAYSEIALLQSELDKLDKVPLHQLSGSTTGRKEYHGNAGDTFRVYNNFDETMSVGVQDDTQTNIQLVNVSKNSYADFTAVGEFFYIYLYTSSLNPGTWSITETRALTYQVNKNTSDIAVLQSYTNSALNKALFIPKLPRFIMHRGASRLAPENTVPAFELAGQNGAWGIETDVYITTDGYFMLSHDNDISNTTDAPSGTKITENTYATIRSYTINTQTIGGVTYSGLKIPTLEEYLEVCSLYGCVPNIEIKSIDRKFAELYEIIKNYGFEYKAVVIQYAVFYAEIRKSMPNATILLNLASSGDDYETQINSIATYGDKNIIISMQYDNPDVDHNLVAMCHQLDFITSVWSVNDANDVNDMLRMGVDLITSDEYSTKPSN